MSLVKWNPAKDLLDLQKELNKVFGEFFSRSPMELGSFEWAPAVDIIENDNEFVVKAELPGITQDDIKVSLSNDVLTIKGEKKQEKEEKGKNFHRIERSYGSFHRSFSLPSKVQADKVKAVYKNGVLEITLPKAEEVKPKEITIDVK